ncbi:carbohydrate sulfotransferase 11-like isoform X1 [Asterias amurensis]|uniref:carbohydrate sulfotransferase 11-like isoform X1 n=2 Tax=Asterias amurensis TaxID=7602 RepID=UPI003AB48459
MASQSELSLNFLKCRFKHRRSSFVLLMLTSFLLAGFVFHEFGQLDGGLMNEGSAFRLAASRLFVNEVPCDASCKWLREQLARKEQVSATCNAYTNTTIGQRLKHKLNTKSLQRLGHLLVLDSHKLMYCYIPKVGCTNWKRILLVLKGVYNDTKLIGQSQSHTLTSKFIKPLSSYSLEEATERLENYTKFVFVRHPLERILSGFRDKFQKNYGSSTIFRKNFGPKIASYGSTKKVPLRPDGTLNVTFGQFVRYIGDSKNIFSNDGPTEHWSDMYKMCQPCMINYDIIGKFSSLHEDANFTLQAAGMDGKVSYPQSTNPTNSSDEAHITSYFSDLPPDDIRALLARYVIDMDLFGFSVPRSLKAMLANGTDGLTPNRTPDM